MDWNKTTAGMRTKLVGSVDGAMAVVMVAYPRLGRPGEGFEGWTIDQLTISPTLRGDASFTASMIPEIIDQVKAQGWVTDEELVQYRWEDDGIHAGSLHVRIPLELRHALLAQRVVMRDEVDKLAEVAGVEVAEPLTDEVVQVIEWAEAVED